MDNFKSLCLILLLVTFGSCKKELPFPDINAPEKIVINSTFSPDNDLEVHVSENCHIADTLCEFQYLTDASVVLRDGNDIHLADLEHMGNGVYKPSNFNLQAEKTYRIEANKANDNNSKITSQSTIPKEISCTYIGKETRDYDGQLTWSFEVEINDDPEEANFYLLEGYFEFDGAENSGSENEINGYIIPKNALYSSDINTENKSIYEAYDYVVYGLRSVYLPDYNFNGQTYKAQFAIKNEDIFWAQGDQITAKLFVKSVSKEMYEHHKSVENHLFSQANAFSEPTPLYSNISNGLGLFAGYTQKTFSIDIPVFSNDMPRQVFIDNEGCVAPCEISFSTDGESNLEYYWKFGDGTTSTEANPAHTYSSPGNYEASLDVSSPVGDESHFGGIQVRVN